MKRAKSLRTSPARKKDLRPPDLSRHVRKCRICSHPRRQAIERDFIRWRSPALIAADYNIAARSSVYLHAHATGLFRWRKQQLGRVLENMLESAENIPLERAEVIIRAATIYAHLDEAGNWSGPAKANFILTGPSSISRPGERPSNDAARRAETGGEEPEQQ